MLGDADVDLSEVDAKFYYGILLNQPHRIKELHAGGKVLFFHIARSRAAFFVRKIL